MSLPKPPILSYKNINKISEDFLEEHHPSFSIPIPIEDIIELVLSIKISSYNGLKKNFDIDGFITSDFSEVVIDNGVFLKFKERARFTLAHEIGHMVLHQKIYEKASFSTPEEVVKFQELMSDKDYGWFQYQANVFAACLLTPSKVLKKEYENAAKEKEKINKEEEFILPYLQYLPFKFEVSADVLIQRIKKEELF